MLCRIARGKTRNDIARELSMNEGAVKAHVKSLLYKARQKQAAPVEGLPRVRTFHQHDGGPGAQARSQPSQAEKHLAAPIVGST